MACPSFEQILAWQRNQLPEAEAERIQLHLNTGCQTCDEEDALVQRVVTAAATRHLTQPPAWLVRQAHILFAQEKPKPSDNLFQRILGFLSFDSHSLVPALGFRRNGPLTRQMVYEAGEYNVNLSIRPMKQHRTVEITGQTVPLNGEFGPIHKAKVELWEGTRPVHMAETDKYGLFVIGAAPYGVYDLRITLPDAEIKISGLNVTPRLGQGGDIN